MWPRVAVVKAVDRIIALEDGKISVRKVIDRAAGVEQADPDWKVCP